jgi:putative methanogen marker protein 4
MAALKERFQLPSLMRMVIMESREGEVFFLASVGIDEGWTVEEKQELVRSGSVMMRHLGVEPRVAVMSGGRSGDKGRNVVVDRSIDDALLLVDKLREEGYDAYHAEILLESAVREANMIIAPDGMSGNIIFRALHFVGGCKALGAPVLNLGKVFVDTSRAKTDFRDSIALALRLVKEVGK